MEDKYGGGVGALEDQHNSVSRMHRTCCARFHCACGVDARGPPIYTGGSLDVSSIVQQHRHERHSGMEYLRGTVSTNAIRQITKSLGTLAENTSL